MSNRYYVLAFVLQGKVQGVKLRRYVEAAGRHFGVGGYVINTEAGDVWGEAWMHESGNIDSFGAWIRGEHTPAVYTNIKPTPVGSAYPERARVARFAVLRHCHDVPMEKFINQFVEFTMVRDDQEAAVLLQERKEIQGLLSSTLAAGENRDTDNASDLSKLIEIGSWPQR